MKNSLFYLCGWGILAMFIWSCDIATPPTLDQSKQQLDNTAKSNSISSQNLNSDQKQPNHSLSSNNSSIGGFGCIYDEGCTLVSGSPYTSTITVPGYAPCKAKVTYDLYYCPVASGGSSQLVIFDNFSAEPNPGPDCQALLDHWTLLFNNGQYVQLDQEMAAFSKSAQDALELLFMTSFVNQNKTTFQCGTGYAALSSKFYSSLCYKYCVVYHPGSGNTAGYITYDKLYCGDACCEKKIGWCWNPTTQMIEQSTPTYITYGVCGGVLESCATGTVLTSCSARTCEP